jgi:hypothetical protein
MLNLLIRGLLELTVFPKFTYCYHFDAKFANQRAFGIKPIRSVCPKFTGDSVIKTG